MRSIGPVPLKLAAGSFAALFLAAFLPACQPSPGCDAPEGPEGPIFAAAAPAQTAEACDPPPPCEDDCGGASGDPHIKTFDGRRYDLQTAAEVVGARAKDRSFEVQWRQEPLGSTRTSVVTAVAMRIRGTRVMVSAGTSVLRVDSEEIDIPEGKAVALPTGVLIHHLDRQIVVVHKASRSSVHIQLDKTSLGVLVDPPDTHKGNLEGLLGNADGDRTNDLVFADGQVLRKPSWDDLHPGLAEAWRVTDDNTLFDYDKGEGSDTYWDPTFPGHKPSIDDFNAKEKAEAERVCRAAGVSDPGLLKSCIFDVLVTGDESMAELFARQQLAAGIALNDSAPGTEEEDDKSADLVDGSVEWTVLFKGTNDVTSITSGDDRVFAQMDDKEAEAGVLVGIKISDGSTWRLDGISHRTKVAFVDGVVVAVAQSKGPFDGDKSDGSALIAVDPSTGKVLDDRRYDPQGTDERPIRGGRPIVAVGDSLLFSEKNSSLRSFAAKDLSLQWEVTLPAGVAVGPYPVTTETDNDLAWVGWNIDGQSEIGLIDMSDGEIVDTLRLDRKLGRFGSATTTDDGSLLLPLSGKPASILSLEAKGSGRSGRIERRWKTELEEKEWHPGHLAIAGGNVVGYSGNEVISGFSLTNGKRRFDARTTSFENNGGLIAGNESGMSFVAVFGGAYFEAYDANGERRWALSGKDVVTDGKTGEGRQLLAIGDDLILVGSTSPNGVLIVAAPADG